MLYDLLATPSTSELKLRWRPTKPKLELAQTSNTLDVSRSGGKFTGDMDSKQIVDCLADHLALYHSASSSTPKTPQSKFRSNVVRWISGLTVEQRQAALTIVDEPWVSILLQMEAKVQKDGAGFFILLPDVPVQAELPSLCYRKAKGLLARVCLENEEEKKLVASVRLFSSKEGQFPVEKSAFDSLIVTEDLVKDVDYFVAAMDKVSDGDFLRSGNSSSLISVWEELTWLKAKGYYSVGAFVANKLELALRMSWLNSHGKKRGGNCVGNGAALAGFAANVFWRKKACVEWWRNVEPDVKARAFKFAVTKTAKVEVNQLVGNAKDVVGKKTRSLGKSSAVHKVISDPRVSYDDNDLECHIIPSYLGRKYSHRSGLYMLQELSLPELICKSGVSRDDNLFFSSLSSTHTVLDNIMRRVREVFAKVSKDYVELDLLNEEKAKNDAEVTKKEKRRKGRSKKKKVTTSKQNLQNTFAKQPLEDSSPKKMACEEYVQNINKDMDSRKGITSSQTDPGKMKVKIKKEKSQSFKCQEKDRRSPTRLQNNLETKQSAADTVEVDVKINKKGRGRSKMKKKDTVNLDVALLTNGKGIMPGDCCEQTKQQAVDIQQSSSVEYDKCSGHIDGPAGDFCSPIINSSSSLVSNTNTCTDDNRCVCSAKQSITCLDKVGTETPLSIFDLRVNHDSDIKEVGAQKDSSPKSNIFERDKGDANFLSGDCNSTSASIVPSKGINLDEIITSSGIDLSYRVQHCKLNNKLEPENLQCSFKSNTLCSGMCNSNSMELLGPQDAPRDDLQQQQRSRHQDRLIQETANFMSHTSYEWPGSLHRRFPPSTRHPLPQTTDRLHLDVDCISQHHSQPSFLTSRQSMVRNSSGQGAYRRRNTKCQTARKGSDQTGCNLIQSSGHSFEAGFTPFMQPSFQAGFIPSNLEFNGHIRMKEDPKYEDTDDSTCDDLKYVSGYVDDFEGYIMSEGEVEKLSSGNASNNADYNQVFGGGVMYWNTADYAGNGFSRPPSLSSEDSSWARHEDDLKFVIEDIVNITSLPATYGNGGVTSPPTTFHSTFDQFCSGTPNTPGNFLKTSNDFNGNIAPSAVGLVPVSEEKDNRSTNKCTIGVVDGIIGEALPHPILRPIVIPNLSKQRARNDLHPRESRSPCLTGNQREPLRLKRPPSPVVLCVPPAPHPPPPSPARGFRKQRRFPNVRSGSSSPRHWGLRGWPSESEMDLDDCRISTGNPEVVHFAWRRKCITATPPMHSLPSALLCDRLVAISQVGLEQEHPDIALPLQSAAIQNNPALQASVSKLHSLLHDEIESFCTQVAAENLMRNPFINAAVERVSRALQVLWPRSRTKIFGSIATGLAVPTSDVDIVVYLPPVRNLEPIKEAGILEGRNGIKETCLQHAARYLADQEWVKSDSLKTIENTVIPIIMLEVKGLLQHCSRNEDHHMISSKIRGEKEGGDMPSKLESESPSGSVRSDAAACETRKTPWGGKDSRELVHLDISFESLSHTGLRTTNLVRELIGHFPAIVPLALVLKQFLTDRSLDHPYSGGLGSYCLVLLITRFLQHEHHSRAVNQNLGSLFMDFLYFFGCVFDPRQMRVSIYGSGMYLSRDRGQSIDPLHIDDPIYDPLHQANNVGRNCFRIHQCIKAFADAHSVLEKEVIHLSNIMDSNEGEIVKILPRVIPSIADMHE